MLRSVESFLGYRISAKDGEIGAIESLHFDDNSWKIKYLVVDIVDFFNSERVLLFPTLAHDMSWVDESIKVDLTKEQIKSATPYSADLPVSDQHELLEGKNLQSLYLAEPWSGSVLPLWIPQASKESEDLVTEIGDQNLRCTKLVKNRAVKSKGEKIGQLKDFIIDTQDWSIRYLVVDTNGILPYGDVLLAPHHLSAWAQDDSCIEADIDSEALKSCPKYDSAEAVNREYITKYFDYEGRFVISEHSSDNYSKLDESLK